MNLTEGFYKKGLALPVILLVLSLAALGIGMSGGQLLVRDIDL